MLLKNQNEIKLNYYNSKFENSLVVVTDRVLDLQILEDNWISDTFGVKKIYFCGPIRKIKQ